VVDESAIEIASAVRSGERKATEVLDACLAEIASGNERLNAFVSVDEGLARAAAEEAPPASPGLSAGWWG
jgi:Asp-tRNA(Asn)/Glu-tRNA(Gln) amidotransferase A subunit family amidase